MGKKTSALGEPPAGFKPARAVIPEVLLRTALGRRDGVGAVQAWDKPWGSLGEGCCRVGHGRDRQGKQAALSWVLGFALPPWLLPPRASNQHTTTSTPPPTFLPAQKPSGLHNL